MEKNIICVGAVYIDTILSVPKYPIEDQKLRASSHNRRRGGNCANTLEVLSQLVSHPTNTQGSINTKQSPLTKLHLLTVLPNEESLATQFVCDSLKNVDISSCIFRPEHTEAAASYILQNTQNQSRTIISHNPLPEMKVQEFITRVEEIASEDNVRESWYHFEGRVPDVTLACVEYLRSGQEQSGVRISVECEKPEREGLEKAARLADVVFYSRLWADAHGFDDPKKFLISVIEDSLPEATLCCTWGEGGAVAVQKNTDGNHEWASVEAWKPRVGAVEVVDTVGAGDTFIAGMLSALNNHEENWTLHTKVAFANEIAGRKVLQDGFAGLGSKVLPLK